MVQFEQLSSCSQIATAQTLWLRRGRVGEEFLSVECENANDALFEDGDTDTRNYLIVRLGDVHDSIFGASA